MAPRKLTPSDYRAAEKSTVLNGHNYTYYHFLPAGPVKDTIFLIHGFPDHPFTFRYLIPELLPLGLQVVAPTMLGYGSTSSPSSPAEYTYKKLSSHIFALAQQLGVAESGIILGGHDWGGALVYRVSLWNPSLCKALFVISTPFSAPPSPTSTFRHPATILPNFAYQLQLASPDLESFVGTSPILIRAFLNAMYGGRTSKGQSPMIAAKGIDLPLLHDVQPSPLLSQSEMDFYIDEYAKNKNGLNGPLNWYRTHELNFVAEQEARLLKKGEKMGVKTLFIAGKRDMALPPVMARGMGRLWGDGLLVIREVDTNHWALWEKPEEVNALIVGWLGKELGLGVDGYKEGSGGGKAKL